MAVATAASSAAQPAERGCGGSPQPGVLALLMGLIRYSLCLDRYPETTMAATALPLPQGGFCDTDVSCTWVFGKGFWEFGTLEVL